MGERLTPPSNVHVYGTDRNPIPRTQNFPVVQNPLEITDITQPFIRKIERPKPPKNKLTRRQKILRRGLPVITALAAATGVTIDKLTHGGVQQAVESQIGAVQKDLEAGFGDPVWEKTFSVRLAPYPTVHGEQPTMIPVRISPDPNARTIDPIQFYRSFNALNPVDVVVVYGESYPGPAANSAAQKRRTEGNSKAWQNAVKTAGLDPKQVDLQHYYNTKQGSKYVGLWGKITLAKPITIDGKVYNEAYSSLNQLQPLPQPTPKP